MKGVLQECRRACRSRGVRSAAKVLKGEGKEEGGGDSTVKEETAQDMLRSEGCCVYSAIDAAGGSEHGLKRGGSE